MVDVFTHLYKKKDLTDARKREKARVIRAETDAENVFVPHINEISDRMSRRIRSERGQSVDRVRGQSSERGQSIERGRDRLGHRSASVDRFLPSSQRPHPSSLSPQHYHQQQPQQQYEQPWQSPLRETRSPVNISHPSVQPSRSPSEQYHQSPVSGLGQRPEHGSLGSPVPLSTTDRGVTPPKGNREKVGDSLFSAEYTVFDSLYDSRLDHAASLWEARETHMQAFRRSTSHQPNIGGNHLCDPLL